MAGVTATIARMVGSGNATLAECAERLGLSREQLENRLRLMERQGYLARRNEDAAPGGNACSCGHYCSGCRRIRDLPAPVIFILTPKGERLVGGEGSG
ncbi:transcriptional regulator [Methanoregula formicica SMSP]|uniref:Transcriptional regulator n=2 Tax=Methanoregula formicica TaxID=882104 RepID=L0HKB0_METFS|nr:transcriptional regulator [Methanoregula formicica SMSP]